jgi:hypothetical protein
MDSVPVFRARIRWRAEPGAAASSRFRRARVTRRAVALNSTGGSYLRHRYI